MSFFLEKVKNKLKSQDVERKKSMSTDYKAHKGKKNNTTNDRFKKRTQKIEKPFACCRLPIPIFTAFNKKPTWPLSAIRLEQVCSHLLCVIQNTASRGHGRDDLT